jgi:hypothetical protein
MPSSQQVIRLQALDYIATSPEQLRAFVRFSLSQLRSRNEHHRFEHLCAALARQRITPNIVVGTGPVSAGGDQGRDFETFRGYTRGHVRDLGVDLGISDSDTIAFCCSVGQTDVRGKIRSDVAAAVSDGSKIDVVVCFMEQDIPTAVRHQLASEAAARHSVHLEVIDGQTIAGLLCDRETFWIAVDFLDIPADLAPRDASPEWYADSRSRWLARGPGALTPGDVIELTACIRFSTFNEAFLGDIVMWLDRMKPMLGENADPVLRRRVRYETAVATYRGLGDLRPADELVRLSLQEAVESSSADELHSAEILYQYAQGAWLFAATAISAEELDSFGQRLEDRLSLLVDSSQVVDQRCLMLSLLGRVRLRLDVQMLSDSGVKRGGISAPPPMTSERWEEFLSDNSIEKRVTWPFHDPDGAIAAWTVAANLIRDAPLFPVRSFAETVSLRTADLYDDPRWSGLVLSLDAEVARSAGRRAAADLAYSRSKNLRMAGRPFAALSELHQARVALVAGDSRHEGAEALLDAAELYRELGLLYAAKHYALAAGAVSSMEDQGRHPYAAASLIMTAQCDFLAGNWFSFIVELPDACVAHADLREAVGDTGRWPDFEFLLDSVTTAVRAMARADNNDYTRLFGDCLLAIGVDYDELIGLDKGDHGAVGRDSISVEEISDQLGQALFADTGSERRIRFAMRGISWQIRSSNNYDDVRAAERFAAATQSVSALIGDEDLILAETAIDIDLKTVRPRKGGKAVGKRPKHLGQDSNGVHLWEVTLTKDLGPYSIEFLSATSEVSTAAMAILLSASMLPESALSSLLDRIFGRGSLVNATFPHIRYDRAYSVISDQAFASAERANLKPIGQAGFGEALTATHLPAMRGPGPVFNGESPAERAANRYPIYARTLRVTIPHLMEDPQVRRAVLDLREEGWKDWHLLMAIFNMVFNFRLSRSSEGYDYSALKQREWEVEKISDGLISPSMVTVSSLREHLMASVPATADAYGLNPGLLSPTEILGVLASRYSYWDDDADHEDFFALAGESVEPND